MQDRAPDTNSDFDKEVELILAGKFAAATKILLSKREQHKLNARLWHLLAEAANGSKDHNAAQEYIKRAIEIEPGNTTFKYRFGQILRSSERHAAAIAILEAVYDECKNKIKCLESLSYCNFRLGNYDKAVKFGGKALRSKYSRKRIAGNVDFPEMTPKEYVKKYITYSLWGALPRYVYGAMINARLNKLLYPGWTSRFYFGNDVPMDVVDDLQRLGCETVPAYKELQDISPYMWRFTIADDPNVDLFICRDSDSRPTAREAAAVKEWLESSIPFHIMRDHILHYDLILAGLWGAHVSEQFNMIGRIRSYQSKTRSRLFGHDQLFLQNEIWPLIQHQSLAHDSFYNVNSNTRRFCTPPGKGELDHIGSCHRDQIAIAEELQSLQIMELATVPLKRR